MIITSQIFLVKRIVQMNLMVPLKVAQLTLVV